jgi:hypothetical protein
MDVQPDLLGWRKNMFESIAEKGAEKYMWA